VPPMPPGPQNGETSSDGIWATASHSEPTSLT
jgi:hypothetical protein